MIGLLFISMLFMSSQATSAEAQNPWEKILFSPAQKESQIYGSYTSGCLLNGEQLPQNGDGFVVVNPYRNRYYAHPQLTQLIKKWGLWASEKKLGKIVIGDIAQPAGGPLTGAHRSHQIGLDADIRFHLLPPDKTIKNKNQWDSTDVVRCHKDKNLNIHYAFKNKKWPVSSTQLLQKIASEMSVERIFVSAGIKRYLCETLTDHPSWLKKIRPEWGHTGHMHVRLKCPEGTTACKTQPSIVNDPTDTTQVGCSGDDYKSWFKSSQEQKIFKTCIPKTEPELIPYWHKVMTSSEFPKECRDWILKKESASVADDKK